jgi:hypothetical protein
MTMDLYGHRIDRNLWDAAQRLGGTKWARPEERPDDEGAALAGKSPLTRDNTLEPPWGIEPQTYALRARFHALLAGSKPAFA